MSLPRSNVRPAILVARLPTPKTVLICSECESGASVRRDIKRAVKAEGRKGTLRVVACDCLDICPKRGAVALIARQAEPPRCVVIDRAATIDGAFVQRLVDD